MNLSGKVALVTGATRGIGRAIAERLLKEGALVIVTGRDQELLRVWQEKGVAARSLDVAQARDVQLLIAFILEEYGRLDIVVNNAGTTRDGLLIRLSDEDWERVLAVNLNGVFYVCRAALRPMLKQRQGKIVNISSVVGVAGNAGQTNYAASKAGVIGFSKALAKEAASRNVLVNVVAPGYIDTEMTRRLTPQQKADLKDLIPLKRTGTVDDVAALVTFLVSDQNQYITGQTIHCDGGLVI